MVARREQLRHADRLATIGQLAAGIAHELNEPLANVLGFAQLARKAENLPQEIAEDLDKIIASALHARDVVRKLTVFARQAPPERRPTNLNRVVEGGLALLESRLADRTVEVVRDLDPALPDATGDPQQLQQVVVNLAVNALQAMPGGGRLRIATRRSGAEVVIVVEDSGAGMSEAVLARAFQAFFTTKDADHGTGLGLSVAGDIVAAHGGRISASSTPGRGSRFEVALPSAESASEEDRDGTR